MPSFARYDEAIPCLQLVLTQAGSKKPSRLWILFGKKRTSSINFMATSTNKVAAVQWILPGQSDAVTYYSILLRASQSTCHSPIAFNNTDPANMWPVYFYVFLAGVGWKRKFPATAAAFGSQIGSQFIKGVGYGAAINQRSNLLTCFA